MRNWNKSTICSQNEVLLNFIFLIVPKILRMSRDSYFAFFFNKKFLFSFSFDFGSSEKCQNVCVCYERERERERAICPVPTPTNIHFRHHTSDLSHNAPGRAVGRSPSWFCRGFRYSSTEWILLLSLTSPPELFEFWRNSVKEKMTGRQPACVIDNGTG